MRILKYINEKAQDEPSFSEELENIGALIRKMGRSQNFGRMNVSIEEDNILVEIVLKKEETFSKVNQVLDFIEKIKKDILVGFKVDMDLWETKKGEPIFTFEFYYSASTPTYDYDEDLPY
jgi:hypothetical protein